jgi:hypothetical protein
MNRLIYFDNNFLVTIEDNIFYLFYFQDKWNVIFFMNFNYLCIEEIVPKRKLKEKKIVRLINRIVSEIEDTALGFSTTAIKTAYSLIYACTNYKKCMFRK